MTYIKQKWLARLTVVLMTLAGAGAFATCPKSVWWNAESVVDWAAEHCGEESCGPIAHTCNQQFSIEHLGTLEEDSIVTFHYRICQKHGFLPLKHWTLDLSHVLPCVEPELVDTNMLGLMIVDATLDGEPLMIQGHDPNLGASSWEHHQPKVVVDFDHSTQLYGLVFDVPLKDKCCHDWSVTFDTSYLLPGQTLCEGCVMAAAKVGLQDLRRPFHGSPGYACVVGPVCCPDDGNTDPGGGNGGCETAFAYGDSLARCFIVDGFSRWGWTNGPLPEGQYTFDIYAAAGQCNLGNGVLVGTLTIDYQAGTATVTYLLNSGFTMTEVQLYVGSGMYPLNNQSNPTVAPGQYPFKDDDLNHVTSHQFVVTGLSGSIYVIAHAVVCEEETD